MAHYLRHVVVHHEAYQIIDIPDGSPTPSPSELSTFQVVKQFGEHDYTKEDPVRLLTKVELLLADLPVPEGM